MLRHQPRPISRGKRFWHCSNPRGFGRGPHCSARQSWLMCGWAPTAYGWSRHVTEGIGGLTSGFHYLTEQAERLGRSPPPVVLGASVRHALLASTLPPQSSGGLTRPYDSAEPPREAHI